MYSELRTVRDRVEEVLGVVSFLAQDPELLKRHESELRAFFGRSRRRADVFLTLHRDRNVTQVAVSLGMKRQNVSTEIRALERRGLVRKITTGGQGDIYVRQPILEQVRLTERVREWFASAATLQAPEESANNEDAPDGHVAK